MTSYFIENAKSGRAKCKKCKESLPSGELRIGTKSLDERFGPDKYTVSYSHIECFVLPRKLGKITAAEFVQDNLDDETDDVILSDEARVQEIADKIGTKKAARKSTGGEGDDNAISKKMGELKSAAKKLEEEEGDEKPAKKAKGGNKFAQEVDAMVLYGKKTIPELKDLLRWNLGYGMTGTKDVLLMRVIDGHVNGRLARCPTCFKGKMQLNDDDAGETVKCTGYFDEEMNIKIPCSYKTKASAASRLQPWYFEEPSEEEMEALKEITKKHEENAGGATATSSDIPAEVVEAATKLEWPNTSSMEGKKAAAQLMVDLCTDVLDIPEDIKKANMGIGKIIVNNPDASASEILELVVKEYGVKQMKQAASTNQKNAIESSCACPANAPIVQAFKELGELYFKEGNANAGASYTKATNAIMGLNFEITLDNAKKLSKAGKNGMKVDGIGKGSSDKIYEFLETGKIEKLEEKRALNA